jgi:hypothetical protein
MSNQSFVIFDSITRNGRIEPFDLQVGRNQITGHQPVELFGYGNATVGSTALGPLWEGGTVSGGAYTYPSSAGQVVLLSASGATDAGLIIQVNGLDANYNLLSEKVTLNGSGTATTTNSYLRINGMFVTNGVNAGNITGKIATVLYAQINSGVGQTQMSIYTVPAGYTFYLTYVQGNASIGFTSSAYMTFAEYNKFNIATTIQDNGYQYTVSGNTTLLSQSPFVQIFEIPYTVPVGHPGGTDIQFQIKASTGSNYTASIFAGGYLVQNDGVM